MLNQITRGGMGCGVGTVVGSAGEKRRLTLTVVLTGLGAHAIRLRRAYAS